MNVDAVLKRLQCKRTKCNKQDKAQKRKLISFQQQEAKKCPKTHKNYLQCSRAFYEGSQYKRLSDDYEACVEKYCPDSKQQRTRQRQRQRQRQRTRNNQ